MAATPRFDPDLSQKVGRKSRSMLRGALMVTCAIAMTCALSGKVFAQEDDEDSDKSPEQTVIDTLMRGIGARNIENSGINYRERSPLVVPPTNSLPPPEDRSKVAVAPNWPKDPDVTKNKIAAQERKKNAGRSNTTAAQYTDAQPLSADELNKGKLPKGSVSTAGSNDAPGGDPSTPLYPSQLGYNGGMFGNLLSLGKKQEANFEREPERSSLAQPPVGYQTPSSSYSYGVDPSTRDTIDRPTAAEQRIHDGAPN
jgi:hypothetical protein